jgi:asparagine synthase (glutamine-hydrolysing)
MCGIAVALALDPHATGVAPWALPHMRHRGPDGDGVLADRQGPVLEHCRLAVIDPANRAADQPLQDRSGRYTLVYNGELFNYRALRRELEQKGVQFSTSSDTEVVLHALIHDGVTALRRFRGMFAFVLWDAAERRLVAARDHIGVKPLYYAIADGLFVAASELRTVIAHPALRPRLDPAAVVEYLSFGHVAGSGTLLQGVSKLLPGHVLSVENGTADVAEYWDVPSEPAERSDADAARELRARLDDAVAGALVSDVPVSLMLSGGLDSGAIAARAAHHSDPRELTAYSVAFGTPGDESSAARQLAETLGIGFREVTLTKEIVEGGFDGWLARLDVPSSNPTWIAVSALAAAVKEDGHKVLLSGDGGDELFGGYNRWMTYLRFHDKVWNRVPSLGRRAGGWLTEPVTSGLAKDIARRAKSGGELFVGSRAFHDDDLRRALGPVGRSAAADVPPETTVNRVRQRFRERFPGGDQLTWMSYLALKTDLVEDYLVRLDTMGMAESVEGRVPLLDVDLVEFAFSLSRTAKIGRTYEQKALFRRAVSSFLPEFITARPKQGFCAPVAEWALELLRPRLPAEGHLVEEGLVDPGAVRRLCAAPAAVAGFPLWTLGTLSLWCERTL